MEKSQPFFWLEKRFPFNTQFMKGYRLLQEELQTQDGILNKAESICNDTKEEISCIETALKKKEERISQLKREISQAEEQLDTFKEHTQSPLRLDAYFEETGSNEVHLFSPWGYKALNQCRAKLFMEAMALHKAFVRNSRFLRENLDAFSKMMRGMIPVRQLPIAAPILLQSFMLMVPVVSTTFASVGTFLRYIPNQEIAYLFIDAPQNIIRKWVNECIGTIHTFQGKETDTVVLCLGVDSTGKNMGAVEWACERPNILNVAVTRSKENLYIVGDKAIWAGKPFFKTAYEICQEI